MDRPGDEPSRPSALLAQGLSGPHVDSFRARVRAAVGRSVSPLVQTAEQAARFPREAITDLASDGLYRDRWHDGGDLGKALVIAEELGFAAAGGVGIGISVHLEAVLATLLFHGTSAALRHRCEAALDGTEVGCVAFSEDEGGSDLTDLETVAHRDNGKWSVQGEKAFVSLGAAADFALVLCKDADRGSTHAMPSLTLICVPSSQYQVVERLPTLGNHSLETVRIRIDATVEDDMIVGRPGRGLLVAARGLAYERFAGSAQLLGGLKLAVSLAATHLHKRHAFGKALFDHQALRLRLAAINAELMLATGGLQALAASARIDTPTAERAVAGAKVALAHLAERGGSECLHIFGGRGYIETHTPLARMWRDSRLARLGGGGDEVLLELAATALHGDAAAYERHVAPVGS